MFSEIVQQGNAQLIDAPIIFHEFSAFVAEDVHRPDAGVFVVFGTSIACGGMEVESPMTGEGQAVTARNASALIVAGLARSIQLVVETAPVVHGSQKAAAAGAEIKAGVGGDTPDFVAALFLFPAPVGIRAFRRMAMRASAKRYSKPKSAVRVARRKRLVRSAKADPKSCRPSLSGCEPSGDADKEAAGTTAVSAAQ